MYSRITASSRPTVETKYPRAQKCCPTKLRLRSPYTRARWIALLPLMNPTTCDTAYFGGIDDHHVHVIGHQMPFLDPALLLLRQLAKHLPKMPPQLPVQRLPAALRDEHHVVFALPLRVA